MKRRALLALLASGLVAAPPAAAVVLLWTVVLTPLTTTVGQSTTFTVTATNLDALTELGCLEVDLPGSFVIETLGTPVASNGDAWASYQSGNAVIAHSLSGGGRLEMLASVKFNIQAHATAAGTFLWPNHGHRQQDCSSNDLVGVPLSVTVLPVVIATPTPTPTPMPTPKPTPAPTPILPLPTPILPLPSIHLLPTPRPTPAPVASPTATATPRETATPEPSRSTAGDGSGGIGSGPPGGGPTGGTAGSGLTVGRGLDDGEAGADVGVELFAMLDADFVWFVPAASVGLPGLLVIAWVLLQAFGALAWIPAVRRMAEERGHRRSRPA